MQRKRKLFWALMCLVWFGVIFLFSQSSGTDSHGLSGSVTSSIASVVIPDFSIWPNSIQADWVNGMNSVIRKVAHFVEYCVAGMLVFSTVNAFMAEGRKQKKPRRRMNPAMISFYLCLLMAAADEVHQLYVDGRTNSILDVVLDCVGIVSGILFVYRRAARKGEAVKQQRRSTPVKRRAGGPNEYNP